MSPSDRVLTRVVAGPNGCIVSTYSVGSHGYAQAFSGKVTLAHRVAWEAEHGPIPEGMTVDHLCHNRRCVNHYHMRLLSNVENARRNRPDADSRLEVCINGHDAPRVVRKKKGREWLRCIECERLTQRRYRESKRG